VVHPSFGDVVCSLAIFISYIGMIMAAYTGSRDGKESLLCGNCNLGEKISEHSCYKDRSRIGMQALEPLISLPPVDIEFARNFRRAGLTAFALSLLVMFLMTRRSRKATEEAKK
jgi:hypothetical protein